MVAVVAAGVMVQSPTSIHARAVRINHYHRNGSTRTVILHRPPALYQKYIRTQENTLYDWVGPAPKAFEGDLTTSDCFSARL
jgi:hypothetical protein